MPLSTYQRDMIGAAVISASQPVQAGQYASFDLVYTAGFFGIDDSGSLKITQRFASDMARPQFAHPAAPNYVSIEASNGATLAYHFDVKNNIRPWGKTLYIKVVKGYLRQGDQIIVHYGNRTGGSPGIRMQTFCEDSFEFKVLVDAFATYDYVELPQSPTLKIIPGPSVKWVAVLPTTAQVSQKFRLSLKAEDLWGNPSDKIDATIFLKPSNPVNLLPEKVTFKPGSSTTVIENLSTAAETDLTIELHDPAGGLLARSNPCRIINSPALLSFWGDLHGQSEETIGTNSAADYFQFARDKAFLDVMCHQGNDFQITREFWSQLQQLNRSFTQPGRFVSFPGYEWSGNTSQGGDHNVIFLHNDEQIHRSSHALVYDHSDLDTDCHTTNELFRSLKDKDVFFYAHVGGRYADLTRADYSHVPLAVEIHSAWGTFEWLLHDAFALGLRVGIVANSDGHKGRPGASYPGASMFGSYGGLTCFLAPGLTREDIFQALCLRHHYATTGARLFLHTSVTLPDESHAIMGDIVPLGLDAVTLNITALCSAPIERLDIFNGPELLHTYRPFTSADLGRRIRVIWQGAEYRGRGRETTWDGSAKIIGNEFIQARPINFWNPEKPLSLPDPHTITWQSITTGGLAGFDAILADSAPGTINLDTPLVKKQIKISDIRLEDLSFDAAGLDRRIRLFRLPDENSTCNLNFSHRIDLRPDKDNPLYVRLTTEDGHLAWTSPIYLTRPE